MIDNIKNITVVNKETLIALQKKLVLALHSAHEKNINLVLDMYQCNGISISKIKIYQRFESPTMSIPEDYVFAYDNLAYWIIKNTTENDSITLLNIIFKRGFLMNTQGYSIFNYVAKIGSLEILKFLLEYYKKSNILQYVNAVMKLNDSFSGKMKLLKNIHQYNCTKINIKNTSILTCAAEYGHIHILEYMRKKYGLYDYSNLFYAAIVNGNPEVVHYMIKHNIKPDSNFEELSLSLLSSANFTMMEDVLNFLEKKDLTVDMVKDLVENGKIENINQLMNLNYNVYIEDKELLGGNTVKYAAYKNKVSVLRFFLEKEIGWSILEEQWNKYSPEIIEYLKDFKGKKILKEKLESNLKINNLKRKVIKI